MRAATLDDLGAITDIYNQAILTTTATFDTTPKTLNEQRVWFAHHDERYPVFVAELDGVIVGWASLSRWSDRCACADTGEISIYIREDCRGKGIGKQLMAAIIDEGQQVGLHTVLARIASGNEVSVRLHEAVGFKPIGVMREVGRKFGMLLDIHLMQKICEES
ncbi:MAG: N-acetyltransferase [Anaerolineae bacterium]|nr:N-acetyltransferase [Anaerolineae bacterium]